MLGIQYIREKYNISLSTIAELLNISRQAISAWEQGIKKVPESRLEQLCELYGINYDDQLLLLECNDKDKIQIDNKIRHECIEKIHCDQRLKLIINEINYIKNISGDAFDYYKNQIQKAL